MVRPYFVEEHKIHNGYEGRKVIDYALHRTGYGPLVVGTDLAFMHKLEEMLNEDALVADVHR